MRIVAGAARGRRLTGPPGRKTRPTSDRVREAMFSSLSSWLGGFEGVRALDLYAGAGALGLEALSRGAASCLLVESDPRAARAIKANIRQVGLPGAMVTTAPVERLLATPPEQPYDLVMADPPYSLEGTALTGVLALLTAGWLSPGAVVVVERSYRSSPLDWPSGIVSLRERRYGETMLWYGRTAEPSVSGEAAM